MRSPARRSSAIRAISDTCWSPAECTKCIFAKSTRRRKVGSEDEGNRKEELPQVDILEVGLFLKVRGSWLLRPLRIGMPETITSSSCIVGTFEEIYPARALRALGLLLFSRNGEDFLVGQLNFFTETAVTPEQKVKKSFPRWEINRRAKG